MIIKKLICLLLVFFLISCEKNALTSQKTSNTEFSVDFLFEVDGIKVYRFYDGGRAHYFTSKGEAITTQTKTVFNGKQFFTHSWEENI